MKQNVICKENIWGTWVPHWSPKQLSCKIDFSFYHFYIVNQAYTYKVTKGDISRHRKTSSKVRVKHGVGYPGTPW